ncbi:MAG: peptide deformylase [Pseudomonadota bacterium]
MAILPILIHPDPRLKKPCEPVSEVDETLRRLIDDMFETMYDAPGIGLAAPQIGVLSRLLVMDCAGREQDEKGEPADCPPDPIAMINPEITWSSDETRVYNEGCLSIPEQFEDVTRPSRVRVRWLDPDGASQERAFDGVHATCVQHEIDHLNGKLFIDYLGPVKRSMITGKMKKLKRERAKERADNAR